AVGLPRGGAGQRPGAQPGAGCAALARLVCPAAVGAEPLPRVTAADGASRRVPPWVLWSILALIALGGSLGLSEGFLRPQGMRPRSGLSPREPVLVEPEPVLGWGNRPGRYVCPGYSSDVESIAVTIWPDGRRATRAHAEGGARDGVVLLGDSLTMGWA